MPSKNDPITEVQSTLTNLRQQAETRSRFPREVWKSIIFAQTYDLLRPKTGHLMLDGFFFLHENEEMRDKSLDFNDRMTRLCLETRAPFLTLTYDSCASLNHFVINRPDDRPCPLEKQYLGTKIPQWGWQIGSNTVTQFKETEVKTPLLNKGSYRGDKGLYESFRQNGLLHYPDLDCYPLQEKDANL